MPGLRTTINAHTTPGIAALVRTNPNVRARVARVAAVTAVRVLSSAKRLAPVDTGRLKTSLTSKQLDEHGLVYGIGTNVVADPPKGTRLSKYGSRVRDFLAKRWKFARAHGYSYPARQEYETKFKHPTGEWGYLRKSLARQLKKMVDQSRRAILNALRGKP